jgi:hypothetical protein
VNAWAFTAAIPRNMSIRKLPRIRMALILSYQNSKRPKVPQGSFRAA